MPATWLDDPEQATDPRAGSPQAGGHGTHRRRVPGSTNAKSGGERGRSYPRVTVRSPLARRIEPGVAINIRPGHA
jgi:hypothetical protein